VRNGNQLILYPRPDIDMIVNDLAKKKPTFLARRADALHRHQQASKAGPRPQVAQDLHVGRRALAGRGAAGLREADRRHADRGLRPHRDLAHRRDLAGRQERAAHGSCGLPMPGTIIEIRDMENKDRVLPAGKENVGEVCIIGPQVMKGYWKKQDETDKVLFTHPNSNWKGLRTGDMGYMDQDGWVFLVDRSMDLIISSGYNVYPRMIEEAVLRASGVDECIVIGIPDPYRQEAPKVSSS
jgi:long-chain acyl-CoA synthetase